MSLKVLFISFSFLYFSQLNAQYYTISDIDFASWLQNKYPNCMLGNQMDTTCVDIVSETEFHYNGNCSSVDGVQFFDSLKKLSISGANVFTIPLILPNTLDSLSISAPVLGKWPLLPISLEKLVIATDHLDTLPLLPNNLKNLRIIINRLTKWPLLPNSLEKIELSNISTDTLPPLPNSIIEISTTNIYLKKLQPLPTNLRSLSS